MELADIDYRIQKPILRDKLLDCLADSAQFKPNDTLVNVEVPAGQAPVNDTARVLLAEDNPVNQEVARGMLASFGFDVVVAINGQEAVERVADEPFDIILMDCQMPVVDGFDATREIRQWEITCGVPRRPIIAVTANALPEDRERCIEAGMDDFLSKPYTIDKLRDLVKHYLNEFLDNGEM